MHKLHFKIKARYIIITTTASTLTNAEAMIWFIINAQQGYAFFLDEITENIRYHDIIATGAR